MDMNKRQTSIYSISPATFIIRLAASVLLVNIFVIALAGMSSRESKHQHMERAEVTARNLTRILEQTLTSNFDKVDLILRAVADETSRRHAQGQLNRAAMNAYLERQKAFLPFLDNLRITSKAGDFICGLDPAVVATAADREHFIRLRDNPTAQMVISKPIVGRINNKWTIYLARRLNYPDGSFAGMVSAGIAIEYFYRLFADLDVGRRGIISLRDGDLAIVTHYPVLAGGASQVGKTSVSRELRRRIESGQTAASYTAIAGTDGIERTYSFLRMSRYPYYLIVGFATDDYLAGWRRGQIHVWSAVGLFLAMTLLASHLIFRDWLNGKHALLALEQSNELLVQQQRELDLAAQVFEQCRQAMVITDRDGKILRVNSFFSELTGFTAEEAIGQTPRVLKSNRQDAAFYEALWKGLIEQGSWVGEIWNRKKNGDGFASLLNISSVRNEAGEILYYIGINEDITEQKETSERIYHLAHYDLLTNLPNRQLFEYRFSHAVQQAERHNRQLAIMILDLDNFKKVNDTLGHYAGDVLLQSVAQRLLACLRKTDTVARLGGDEFAVLLEEVYDPADARRIAQKIMESVAEPVELEGTRLHVGVSIGVCLCPDDGSDIVTLFKNADTAMYRTKGEGKHRCQFFDADMAEQAARRLEIELELQEAIPDELFLLYQPQADIAGDRIFGVEALVRWRHPQLGVVSPADFIPIAEESGLINRLGEWVLATACRQASVWHKKGLPLKMAVNVSAMQFNQPGFVETVGRIIGESGIPYGFLELELTESLVMSNVEEAVSVFRRLKELGVTIAMDDFGTGYSSLAYLKRLPIDRLKIDRSFITDLPHDRDDVAVTRTIIAMARSLNINVIAEGVEQGSQCDFLRQEGCEEFQGFALARPLLPSDLEQFILRSTAKTIRWN